jgi:hypothetical protein
MHPWRDPAGARTIFRLAARKIGAFAREEFMSPQNFGQDVHWIDFDETQGVYRFRIGLLQQPITIRLHRQCNGRWWASRSHAIKTPDQLSAYRGSFRSYDSVDQALRREVSAISLYYRLAVKNGYQPHEDWLRPAFNIVEGGQSRPASSA